MDNVETKTFSYPALIKEVYLDTFGHMNNAVYLILFEEACWDLITKNGYGVNKIKESGLGPTIMEIKIRYLKELRLREEIVITTKLISYRDKIGKLKQDMVRGNDICCTAEITFGLFSLSERKLVLPTTDWLKAVGVE